MNYIKFEKQLMFEMQRKKKSNLYKSVKYFSVRLLIFPWILKKPFTR